MAATKEQSNRSHRAAQDNIRDIAKSCPEIQDEKLRAEVLDSLPRFCEVVLKPIVYLPFATVHYRLMEKTETIMREGGNDCTALPRGSGKSSLYRAGALWGMLNGFREHILLIGANQGKSNKLMAGMVSMLSKFPLMLQLFPEVCWPFWALEGIVQRRLLWNEKPLTYSLKSERIILPDTPLPFNRSAFSCVSAFGLHTAIRGEEYTRPDGRSVRPDALLFDDPQTKQSAKSETQIQDRMERINESIIGASGPNVRLAAMAAVTCIEENDLAERLLNDPIWGGEKFALMPTMPTSKRWDEYGDMLRDDLRTRKGRDRVNAYYTANRTEMDAGGSVYWEHKRKPDEVSALQGAMEIFLLKPETFWSDFQQDPAKARHVDENDLTVADVSARVNGLPRYTVPTTATTLTCMMDVQESMFVYAIVAWGNGFTGDVIDFNTFPEQKRNWWTKRSAQQRLDNAVIEGRKMSECSREERWLIGLRYITTELLTKEYPREGGAGTERIKRLMIDCQDGDFMSIGYSFIRQSGSLRTLMLPSHGEGMNAASKPIAERDNKPGERRGTEWYLDRHLQYHDERIHYNTNFWKDFLRQRLSCDVAAKGALRFWGDDPKRHELLATQILSEKPNRIRNETRGRTVTIFGKPNGDNEGLDVLAGNCVAASSLGVQIEGMAVRNPARRSSPHVSPLKI